MLRIRYLPWWFWVTMFVATGAAIPFLSQAPASDSFAVPLSFSASLHVAIFEIGLYLLFAAALQLALSVAATVVLSPILFWPATRDRYARGLGRFLQFNLLLLFWGSFGNLLWVLLARDKLYLAYDPVVEWFAFLPYSSRIYDYQWGDLRGHLVGSATDTALFILWAGLALSVWSATWASYRRIRRMKTAT